MSKNVFLLQIITPERIAFNEKVTMITVPTNRGIIGILPRHIPLFATLQEGEVKILKNGKEYFLAIGGGFIEVTPLQTSILVTKAVHAQELNEKAILKAQNEARKALREKPKGVDLKSTRALLRSTLVDFKVLQRHRKYQKLQV